MAQSDWKIKKKLLFCGAMILLVLLITGTWSVLRQSLGRLAGDFFYPYLSAARCSADVISDQTLLLFSRRELAAQLERLRNENRRLASQAAIASELLVENDQLRAQLKLAPAPAWRYTNAEVILRDPFFWNEQLKIDRGSLHHIEPGDAVLTSDPDGRQIFVGVVSLVTERTADVITIFNPALRVSAALPLSGAIGVVHAGDRRSGPQRLNVGFLPAGKAYTMEEVLQTSGYEQQIPPGLKIGNLSFVENQDTLFSSEQFLTGTFVPAVQLNRIRFVVVASRADRARAEVSL